MNLHFNKTHCGACAIYNTLACRDKIPIPYHSFQSSPNLFHTYFYNLYFLYPRGNATALVQLTDSHALLIICAIFPSTYWTWVSTIFIILFSHHPSYLWKEGCSFILTPPSKHAHHSTHSLSHRETRVSMGNQLNICPGTF